LLEEIKSYKIQEAVWKKDSTSNVAKKQHSNALLARARQMIEEGDYVNADRVLQEAEQIKVVRGSSDLKPVSFRQDLARRPKGLPKPAAAGQPTGIITADASRAAPRRNPAPTAPLTANVKSKTTPIAKPEADLIETDSEADLLPA